MARALTLDLPEDVERALDNEASRTGKSREQVALEWIEAHVPNVPKGSAEALMKSCGAWSMTSEERSRVEHMIEEERLLEEGGQP
jgi:hypothetical protein